MEHLYDIAYFVGGAALTNTIPHLAAGLMGRPFQSPFAKPPGKGLSSSRVNVAWGFFNLVLGWALITQLGTFDIRNVEHVGVAMLGGLLLGWRMAQHFGEFHGGNTPTA